ncbi:hypothetical protein Drorol1_Dr00027554, partial [Drosera rotundifolia]
MLKRGQSAHPHHRLVHAYKSAAASSRAIAAAGGEEKEVEMSESRTRIAFDQLPELESIAVTGVRSPLPSAA